MTHYATALFVLLSLGPHSLQQPPTEQQQPIPRSSAADARIAVGVSNTAADFQTRLDYLVAHSSGDASAKRSYGHYGAPKTPPPAGTPLPTYPAGNLNSILAGTRQQLLDSLPPDAAPLRAYVMQNFPVAVAGVPANKPIDMRTCGPYINAANDLLNTLKSVNAYRLDLILDSNPTGALYELKPVAGDKLARASRGTLTNVWRGVYNYTVVKDGAKTITGSIDLVREKGNVLRCSFVPADSSGPVLPCDLVSQQ